MLEYLLLDLAKADELFRMEYACLHHQHQRGATRDRTNSGIVRIEQLDRLGKRGRLHKLERDHLIPDWTMNSPATFMRIPSADLSPISP